MRPCALDYAEELKRSLDQDKPGWTQEAVWCPMHRERHELTADPGQRPLLPGTQEEQAGSRRAGPKFRIIEGGIVCFHESTAPALTAACAHCGVTVHAHKDALGRVRSGRHGAGYLEERCPACHRANAVSPAYGGGGIRTSKLAEGAPAVQIKLG